MADAEIWKDIYYVDSISGEIIDYRGYYQASNFGRIRSVDRTINRTASQRNKKCVIERKGRITKETIVRKYPHVVLHKNGSTKALQVHRIIASMFVPNPDNLPCVNHKSEVKTENYAENLEWCTHKYNCNYGERNKKIAIAKIGNTYHKKTASRTEAEKEKFVI